MALTTAIVGASLYGAHSAKKGAEKQAEAIQHGTDASVAEQRRQFDIAVGMQKPFIETGTRALGALEKIYGIAPEKAATAPKPAQPTAQPARMNDPRRRVRRGFA